MRGGREEKSREERGREERWREERWREEGRGDGGHETEEEGGRDRNRRSIILLSLLEALYLYLYL